MDYEIIIKIIKFCIAFYRLKLHFHVHCSSGVYSLLQMRNQGKEWHVHLKPWSLDKPHGRRCSQSCSDGIYYLCRALKEAQGSRLRRNKLIFAFTSSLSRFPKWFQDHILCVDSQVSILNFLQTSEVQVSFLLSCLVGGGCCCCCCFQQYLPFQDPKFSIMVDLYSQRE